MTLCVFYLLYTDIAASTSMHALIASTLGSEIHFIFLFHGIVSQYDTIFLKSDLVSKAARVLT